MLKNEIKKILNFSILVVFLVVAVLFVELFFYNEKKAKASFSYYSTITVDYTKVSNSTQTNFPVLISGTYDGTGGEPDLRTVANGGKVQNSNGYDIGFYTNSDCTTGKMDWEKETYTASTGVINYWVEVSSLSHTANTIFYICYGDSSISTDQSNPSGVWDSNYQGVWHLGDDPSVTNIDSTSNANHFNANVGLASGNSTSGKIGNGVNINDNLKYFRDSTGINIPADSTYTFSLWLNQSGTGGGANPGYYRSGTNSDGTSFFILNSTTQRPWIRSNGTNILQPGSGYQIPTSQYVKLDIVVQDGGTNVNVSFYADGALQHSATHSVSTPSFDIYNIGWQSTASQSVWGVYDEIRISKTGRSADWIATEYNNQNSPSTFYSIGSESGVGGGNPNTGTHTGPSEKVRGGTKIRGGVKFR